MVYAASFRAMSAKPKVELSMTAAAYRQQHAAQRTAGRIPIAVDAFGTASAIRYCAIWGDNADRIAWNAEAIDDHKPERQQRFDAMTSIGARSAIVAMTPNGGVMRVFVDSQLKHSWAAADDMSGNKFSAVLVEQKAAGRFPVRIGATVVASGVRYSAIFAKSDEVLPRKFRIRGPAPIGLNAVNRGRAAKIDEWMEAYVRAHNFRGAAIAVVEGTRLVYAKGYTLAEAAPRYADIEPTTLFRMASVSKTFTGLATWKALAQRGSAGPVANARNTKMQSVLHLRKTNGTLPTGHFASISMRHLLESNSGIDQGIVRDKTVYPTAADPNGATQPLTLTDIKHAIADAPMAGMPGGVLANGRQATVYGRTDYILLGLAVAGLSGRSSFVSGLKKQLLDPLRMARTRGSRSKIEARGSDEAIQHSPDLATGPSAVHNDRRLVPVAYGYDNYEVYGGAGGLSSAVIDVARMGAMLNCRRRNPVFSISELDALIDSAQVATSAGSDKGYYGFDAVVEDHEVGLVRANKGGGLSAVGAGLWGHIGGRFIAIARNGEKVAGAPEAWNTEIDAIAATVDWGDGDLFAGFGMPSLTR